MLLSLLIVCMKAKGGGAGANLPEDIYGLYGDAMTAVLEKAVAATAQTGIMGEGHLRRLLQKIAAANHRRGERDFDHDLVREVLEKGLLSATRGTCVIQKNMWNALLKEGDAPLIKILCLGDAKGENGSTPA